MSENETSGTNAVLGAIENVKKNVQANVKNVKSTVETLVHDVNVSQLKSQVKNLVKEAQKDFAKLVDRDIASAKKKFAAEKSGLEKEIKKQTLMAKKFIAVQKKEITALQTKLEKLVASKKKSPAKKKATKKVAVKKVTKKVAKKK
ncbi:MAG: hypothetical protein K2P81_02680 [Bacteriovoracaceae bacterium]|nr:hypothetical protein [Bacteriovoracaceae bacterium]